LNQFAAAQSLNTANIGLAGTAPQIFIAKLGLTGTAQQISTAEICIQALHSKFSP
jgi:hypothetical protein